jgi:hypothetical protein
MARSVSSKGVLFVKRTVLIFSMFLIPLSYEATSSSAKMSLAPQQVHTVTLYAKNKYKNDPRAFCFNFEAGSQVPEGRRCDLYYGTLYAGDDFDWFQSSAAGGNRSVIKDLGPQLWTSAFTVPDIEPFPKLKPGEQRHVIIDTSGADGADGAPGAPGANGADADGVVRPTVNPPIADLPARRPKNDGKPKVDSLFVKAIVGDMYVIRVVDPLSDFYALFRVDSLERGDKCTISWRIIPPPQGGTETVTR